MITSSVDKLIQTVSPLLGIKVGAKAVEIEAATAGAATGFESAG